MPYLTGLVNAEFLRGIPQLPPGAEGVPFRMAEDEDVDESDFVDDEDDEFEDEDDDFLEDEDEDEDEEDDDFFDDDDDEEWDEDEDLD